MPEEPFPISMKFDPSEHIHLEIKPTGGLTKRISNAVGIKIENGTVMHVDADNFFQTLRSALRQASPQLDTTKRINSIKARMTNKESIPELEELINSETLAYRFEKAKNAFLNNPSDENLGVLFALSREAGEYRDKFSKPPTFLNAIQNEVISLARKSPLRTNLAKAAAHKGRAFRSGIDGITSKIKSGEYVSPRGGSANSVYFTDAAIFKMSEKRAESEENQIDGLMSIVLPDAIVPQMKMDSLSPEKYGFSRLSALTPKEKKRIIKFDDSNLIKQLKLTPESSEIVKAIKTMGDDYQLILDSPVKIRSEGVKSTIKFSVLLEGLDEGKYTLSTIVNGDPLERHLSILTTIGSAATFHILGLASSSNDFATSKEAYSYEFVPIFDTKEEQEAYAEVESKIWEYQDDSTGEWKTVSFKELYKAGVEEKLEEDTPIRLKGEKKIVEGQLAVQLFLAFNCKLKYIPPALIGDVRSKILPLFSSNQNIIAKPMVKGMILYNILNQSSKEYIFSHLSPSAEVKLLFTLDAQFMDLHANNIGITPVVPDHYLEYTESTYTYGNKKNISFPELILDYREGKVSNSDLIHMYNSEGEEADSKIAKKIPFSEALNWPWDVVLFDTDLSFSENNSVKSYHGQRLVPLRSVALSLSWKDENLSPEALKELKKMDLRIDQAFAWLANEDAPILQKIPKRNQAEFRKVLHNELSKKQFNFGNDYEKEGKSLSDLKKCFCDDLSKDENHQIWKLLERNLNLQERYKIAAELFPRATIGQQNTYRERIGRRQKLLKIHEKVLKLKPSDLEKPETQKFIREALDNIPMTSNEREGYALIFEKMCKPPVVLNPSENKKYKEILDQLSGKSNPINLDIMRHSFINMMNNYTRPTYFNIAKAMYPLLADDYAMELELTGNNMIEAGGRIGHFNFTLENQIAKAETKVVSPAMESNIAHLKK